MRGIRYPESGIRRTSPPWPPRGGRACAALLLFGLGACVSADRLSTQEGRILLHVQDGALGTALGDVRISVLDGGGEVERGSTGLDGSIELTFRAAAEPQTSLLVPPPTWVRLQIEKAGFEPVEISLARRDFVPRTGLYLLVRGVALRRAA